MRVVGGYGGDMTPRARPARSMRRAALLLLGACASAPGGGHGADGSDGGDTQDGSDALDGSDGSDGTSTPSVPLAGHVVVPSWASGLPDLAVSAVPVAFGASGGPTLTAALASASIGDDAMWRLDLPSTPPQSAITQLERDGERGVVVAVIAHDGAAPFVDGGAPMRGVAMSDLLVWLEAPSERLGWPAGWSRVDTGLAGRYADDSRCLLNTDQPLSWRADAGYPRLRGWDDDLGVALPGLEASLTVEGTLPDLDPDADGVIGAWYAFFLGERGVGAAFDSPVDATGAFAASLSETPPAGAWLTGDPDWTYAAAFAVAYEDEDGDGAWQEAERLVDRSVCIDGELAIFRYNRPVTTWRGYRFLDCYGARAGWSLATPADDETWTEWRADGLAESLTGDAASCPLFGGGSG